MYETREEWLQAFIERSRFIFESHKALLPEKIRVSVGFTSNGSRGAAIGECWSNKSSTDDHFEIFIKPTLDTPSRICDVLTHELVHAAVGIDAGHGKIFKALATKVGLEGKMTATVAGDEWHAWADDIIEELGEFNYGAIGKGISSKPKKQKTYLLKIECASCGFVARVAKKHIDEEGMICPRKTCQDGFLVCEDDD